jgi:hypothetical protein
MLPPWRRSNLLLPPASLDPEAFAFTPLEDFSMVDDTEPVVSVLVFCPVEAETLLSSDSRRMLVLELVLFRSMLTPPRTVVRFRTDTEGSFSS